MDSARDSATYAYTVVLLAVKKAFPNHEAAVERIAEQMPSHETDKFKALYAGLSEA